MLKHLLVCLSFCWPGTGCLTDPEQLKPVQGVIFSLHLYSAIAPFHVHILQSLIGVEFFLILLDSGAIRIAQIRQFSKQVSQSKDKHCYCIQLFQSKPMDLNTFKNLLISVDIE